jgi:peroxin-3
LLTKYAESKVLEWADEERKRSMERAKKQHYFESTDRTGNLTLNSLLRILRNAIDTYLDEQALVQQIKTNPHDKMRLWDRLKVVSVSRCLAHVYGASCLALLTRTQLSILGGFLYQDTTASAKDSNGNRQNGRRKQTMVLTQRVQECYLSVCKQFMTNGLKDLCDQIEEAVALVVCGLRLSQKVSVSDLEDVLERCAIKVAPLQSAEGLCKLLVRPEAVEQPELSPEERSAVVHLMACTMDVIEHSDAQKLVMSVGRASLFKICNFVSNAVCNESDGQIDLEQPSVPLAKLVPVLSSATVPDIQAMDQWLYSLATSEHLRTFSANVYEAFCHHSENQEATPKREGILDLILGNFT